jgi:hypothetical protein
MKISIISGGGGAALPLATAWLFQYLISDFAGSTSGSSRLNYSMIRMHLMIIQLSQEIYVRHLKELKDLPIYWSLSFLYDAKTITAEM